MKHYSSKYLEYLI